MLHPPVRWFRINNGVRPYSGQLFYTVYEPRPEENLLTGYVKTYHTDYGPYVYKQDELTPTSAPKV
jgi:hypothetical protein